MHDALLVRGLERVGDLQRDPERILDRQCASPQTIGQRFAFDELHDEEVPAVGHFHAVERRDVWMIERGEHLRLALEPGDAVGISETLAHDLDGDRSAELRVARPVDLAHPPGAKRVEDFVGTKSSSGLKRHR